MKDKEKKFIFVLIIVAVVIIILEQFYMYKANSTEYLSQIEYYSKAIGTSDAKGQGIIININDGSDLIHQEDLIIILDELKNAGAEALSINDQRITYNSYLYCDGGVILIDGQKIGNPFTIKAIGNAETLYSSMSRNKGYISTLTNDGIKIEISKVNLIEIEKSNSNITNEINSNNLTNLSKLNLLKKLSGGNAILGSGAEIVIDTSKTSDITALSLLQIINDLNSANVDAISINDNRIVTTSDLMDINKEYIIINSIPISSPYKIKVIGDYNEILKVLNYTNSMFNKLKNNGKNITVSKNNFIK